MVRTADRKSSPSYAATTSGMRASAASEQRTPCLAGSGGEGPPADR
jgi:hypothetical protein